MKAKMESYGLSEFCFYFFGETTEDSKVECYQFRFLNLKAASISEFKIRFLQITNISRLYDLLGF